MKRHRSHLLIIALFCFICVCRADDDVVIPKDVKYQKTSEAVNEKARQKLLHVFSAKATDKDVQELFQDKVLICGPFMWRAIKDEPAVAKRALGEITFEMPVRDANGKVIRTNELKGRLFQSPEDIVAFWKAFSPKMDFADMKIRKLSAEELGIYWSMISFDITEPIFMIESKQHKIVAQFTSPENLTVSWIDDYQGVTVKKDKP